MSTQRPHFLYMEIFRVRMINEPDSCSNLSNTTFPNCKSTIFSESHKKHNYANEHVFGFLFKPCGPMILPNQMEILPRIPQEPPITSFIKKEEERKGKSNFLVTLWVVSWGPLKACVWLLVTHISVTLLSDPTLHLSVSFPFPGCLSL